MNSTAISCDQGGNVMKRVVLISLSLLFVSNLAFAQAGPINLFSDPVGVSCDLLDVAPGLLPIFAVHVLTPGASASQWSAPIPACSAVVNSQILR